jgi:hypothetical protein
MEECRSKGCKEQPEPGFKTCPYHMELNNINNHIKRNRKQNNVEALEQWQRDAEILKRRYELTRIRKPLDTAFSSSSSGACAPSGALEAAAAKAFASTEVTSTTVTSKESLDMKEHRETQRNTFMTEREEKQEVIVERRTTREDGGAPHVVETQIERTTDTKRMVMRTEFVQEITATRSYLKRHYKEHRRQIACTLFNDHRDPRFRMQCQLVRQSLVSWDDDMPKFTFPPCSVIEPPFGTHISQKERESIREDQLSHSRQEEEWERRVSIYRYQNRSNRLDASDANFYQQELEEQMKQGRTLQAIAKDNNNPVAKEMARLQNLAMNQDMDDLEDFKWLNELHPTPPDILLEGDDSLKIEQLMFKSPTETGYLDCTMAAFPISMFPKPLSIKETQDIAAQGGNIGENLRQAVRADCPLTSKQVYGMMKGFAMDVYDSMKVRKSRTGCVERLIDRASELWKLASPVTTTYLEDGTAQHYQMPIAEILTEIDPK